MNRRATVVLLLVAVLLGGFLALMRSGTLPIGGEEEQEETPFSAEPLFAEAEGDEVVAFDIVDNETGESFSAEADDPGWRITQALTEPEEGQVADTLYLNAAARSLTTTVSSRQLSQVEGLAEYGLESARYTLSFNTRGGGRFVLDIGTKTPQGTHYYTQRRGEEVVNLVSAATLDIFIGFLSEPPYAEPTPAPTP